VRAEQTIVAPLAVVAEEEIAGLVTEECVDIVVHAHGVLGLVTQIALLQLVAVAAIPAIDHPLGVVRVLCDDIHAEVAVFCILRMVDVLAILIVLPEERQPRNLALELSKLLEEWALRIERLPKGEWIPLVPPPARGAVHGERRIGGVHRKNVAVAH